MKVVGNTENTWIAIVQNSLLCMVLGVGREGEVEDTVFPHLFLEKFIQWCVPVASAVKSSSTIYISPFNWLAGETDIEPVNKYFLHEWDWFTRNLVKSNVRALTAKISSEASSLMLIIPLHFGLMWTTLVWLKMLV